MCDVKVRIYRTDSFLVNNGKYFSLLFSIIYIYERISLICETVLSVCIVVARNDLREARNRWKLP